MSNFRFPSGPAWSFRAGRFQVLLFVTRDSRYKYDGDDPEGETQERLDNGEFVAFDSRVSVELDGEEIYSDWLCGSVYDADRVAEFWHAHRDVDPMNRNCTIMRAKRGENCAVGHYFPDMVRTAIAGAREEIRSRKQLPYIRESAS